MCQHTAGSVVAHQCVEAAVDQIKKKRNKEREKKKEQTLSVQRRCFVLHSKNQDFSFQ